MRVAFLHARQGPKYAQAMLRSVQKVMPGVECLHLTDVDTPPLDGTTTVRAEWTHPNAMIFKMEHLLQLEGDVLVLDTDVIVQHDLSPVFRFPFDVALTWRDGPIRDPDGNDITKVMPINCGVMFQRSPDFWRHCLIWCSGRNPGWYADQLAVAQNWWKVNCLRLHCDHFNYTPRSADEDVSMRYAVHYKGKSRPLLDMRIAMDAAS